MATVTITSSPLGTALAQLLMCDDLEPGADPTYQLCKILYTYHPLGKKMADTPITMAQSQEREIAIPAGAEDKVKKAFLDEWKALKADIHIYNVMRLSRVYGLASVAIMIDKLAADQPIDYDKLADQTISFNVFDPLNTAGSLVLNQNPNEADFLKSSSISVSGQNYHRSRTAVQIHEEPIYLSYTTSAWGFVGRSVYQRALYPLKSFIQSMKTDDMVTRKAGVLIAKMKAPGSIIDSMMMMMAGQKRQLLKEAQTDNVMQIDITEDIASLNLQNINGAMSESRKNILENIAVAADMPAQMLNSETFAEGFGEGTEDANAVARYIDGVRLDMTALYDYFTKIVQYRAWTPEFYKTVQAEDEEFEGKTYKEAFYGWVNAFTATWPSLVKEPDSEKIKVDDIKLKAIISLVTALKGDLDPDNKAILIEWAADNFNELPLLFTTPLELDYEALAAYTPPQPGAEGAAGGEVGGKPGEGLTGGDKAANVVQSLNRLGAEKMGGDRLPKDKMPAEREMEDA